MGDREREAMEHLGDGRQEEALLRVAGDIQNPGQTCHTPSTDDSSNFPIQNFVCESQRPKNHVPFPKTTRMRPERFPIASGFARFSKFLLMFGPSEKDDYTYGV